MTTRSGEALAQFAVTHSGTAPKDPRSADAARELNLAPGNVAVAVVKATTVIVETPGGQS